MSELAYDVGDIVKVIKQDKYAAHLHELPIDSCVVVNRSAAIVGNGFENSYSLYEIKRDRHSSWYDESSLELVKRRDDER